MGKKWCVVLSGLLGLLATGASAHPHLAQMQPAADSKTAEVRDLRLVFSEAVEARLSSVRLETGEERTVTEPGAQADATDPKVLIVHLYERLPPGPYKVRWNVVAADGHKGGGSYSFLVSR